ncbi:MAG: amidohydrolase family protein [Fuerstiella sp.]|nr:amidohydrolase family protein [Fuerstiella sp.]MCP4855264.1 amidohydrolase family protein [Fuerstiella sp.]
MNQESSRRCFLGSSIAASCGMTQLGAMSGQDSAQTAGTLDIHLHLFGSGDSGSGCRLSKNILEGQLFQLLVGVLRIRERAKTIDEGYVLALAEHLENSGLSKGVILAQDAVYDRSGKPDWEKTPLYIPNDYLFRVVARFPRTMIPCISINPQRADAINELERCVEKGARVLKIHPPIQGVDLSEKKHIPFFRRCADLKVVVMVHTGHEHSAPIFSAALAHPRKLTLALETGCTVVACHCGTGWTTDKMDMLPGFLAMVRQYDNMWGDTAVLGSAGRVRDMSRLLADSVATDRLLHGSDFPFPAAPLAFAGSLGTLEAARLQAMGNFIQQDFALKEALGIGRASAERAYRLLCEDESQR